MKTVTMPIWSLNDDHLETLLQHFMEVREDQDSEELPRCPELDTAIDILASEIKERLTMDYELAEDGSIMRTQSDREN